MTMKNFSRDKTPSTSEKWTSMSEGERKEIIEKYLKKDDYMADFEVFGASKDGQIVLNIKKSIPSNLRGVLLLDLEMELKKEIDQGLTVWLEPVGDKSKLRNLRGIQIK